MLTQDAIRDGIHPSVKKKKDPGSSTPGSAGSQGSPENEKPLSDMKINELKTIADEEKVEYLAKIKKKDLIKLIEKKRSEKGDSL